MAMAWTDNRVELLRSLYADGLSASQIAWELGVTRNAVIGKVNRLGLVRRGKTPVRSLKRKPDSERMIKVKRLAKFGNNDFRMVEANELDTDSMRELSHDDIPLAQRKQLLQLGPNDCRWPYGDPGQPGFFFCGDAILQGACFPYCTFHLGIATGRNTISDIERAKRSYAAKQAWEIRKHEQDAA